MKTRLLSWVGVMAVAAAAFAMGYAGGGREGWNDKTDAPPRGAELPAEPAAVGSVPESAKEVLLRATSHASELRRSYALVEWIRGLRPDQYADAVALATSLPSQKAREALWMLYSAWLKHDPKAAMEDCRTRRNLPVLFPVGVFIEWGQRDLAGAIDWIGGLQRRRDRDNFFYSLTDSLLKLARDDPDAVYRLLARPELAGSVRDIGEIMSVLARRNPAETVQQALALPSARRDEALRAVLETWGARAPKDALAWVAGQPGDGPALAKLREAVLRAWGASDVAAATTYVQTLPPGSARNEAIAQIATGMLGNDPQAAANLSQDVPLAELLTRGGFFYAWAEKDAPAAGRALAERMQKEGGPEKFPAGDGSMREEIFDRWTAEDPKGAAVFALESGGALRDALLPSAVYEMSREDRSEALRWVQALPPGEARKMAFQAVAEEWAAGSTNDVAAWLPSVAPGDDYAAAVAGFAGRAFAADPVAALEWVRTIPDAAAREHALKAGWKEWSEFRGRDQAQAWLKSTQDLTSAERAVLERPRPSAE